MNQAGDGIPQRPPRRWLGPAVVALSGLIMLIWSWGTWPDPIVDFGRELYVPWQLSEGKVLYRDIVSYFNGPLSPYLHALLFRVFGVSLRTLVVFNLLNIALLAALLYRLIADAAGELAATMCGVAFFVLFAFAEFVITGNFNYVCPYSYELPHGITLSLAGIACLARWQRSQQIGWLCAAGVALGLVFLTKAEVSFAASAAMGAGVAGGLWVRCASWRSALAALASLLACALAPVLIAFLVLLLMVLPAEALFGILGSWRWIGDRSLLDLPYFKELAGTTDIGASIATILIWTGGYLLVFGVPLLFGLKLRRGGRARTHAAAAVFLLWLAAGLLFWLRLNWNNFVRPIPLLLLAAAGLLAVQLIRRRMDRILPFVLVVWALGMLAKMPLNAHIYHYGFALAMPATLVGIALLGSWLPRWVDARGGSGGPLRAAVLAALIVAIHAHGRVLNLYWSNKTVIVGSGADAFYAHSYGAAVNAVLDELARLARPDSTLVVVPEGLIINYLARLENPTGQLNFTPPAIVMYGEDQMLRAFKDHPPEFLIVTGVDTAEYGARFFGSDYAQQLGAWMQENYSILRIIGARPFQDPGFGLVLMRKTTAAG